MTLKKIDPTLEHAQVRREDTVGERQISDFAPRQPSFRESAVFSVKLFTVIAAILGMLWLLDRLVTR
jgi:flagellar biogenesis protein FliO